LFAASSLLLTLLGEMKRMSARAIRVAANAERKLEQLLRSSLGPGSNRRRGDSLDTFVSRQNIQRYRSLLESGSLDEAQRSLIERLLSEEQGKLESRSPAVVDKSL